MPPRKRFEASAIKNKEKREQVVRARKKEKGQEKLKRRLEIAKAEKNDPELKKARLEKNVPRTLDNMREFNPTMITADPQASSSKSATTDENKDRGPDPESLLDISLDPFSSSLSPPSLIDPFTPPKVLLTTSPRATKVSYEFCEELLSVIPGAEFVRRGKGMRNVEVGRIAGWAAGRGYGCVIVVNEDRKVCNALTLIHLPSGPSAYFKLTSIVPSSKISSHARPTPHNPELILNNFVTRLGHSVGRMFQTLFPLMPHFQGRQVVTLHNQRDFLFFRRHRYAFRSTEKAALQEIGPRFTLKLKWLKKGLPAVRNLGEAPPGVMFDEGGESEEDEGVEDAAKDGRDSVEKGETGEEDRDEDEEMDDGEDREEKEEERKKKAKKVVRPPKDDEYEWMWKPELETTRRTFFL
ncbi:Brix-domain-containing protein [Sistotremastrum suecicum HHB10207 ss-3]|uniref:Brix-domain-containing protein n=1 Tax=Sistotremastrum suecicum HHB10207 ss-3 TaxID=1314776 RepID=A0A166EAC8_9AGAM|nr:Brix-domain-containing protein [Sistotremastrum suecicum HHB10207 ss-3]